MLDYLFGPAFLSGVAWVAVRAYLRPDGIYRKSLIGFVGAIAMAAGIWLCAGPFIANEAGLGALVIFLVVVAAAGVVAAVACTSATVRHVMDAWAR
jgi:hypothetical protein